MKEKRLVTLLAKYYLSKDEENELNNLMAEYLNWGEVLGHLMMNRVMEIAWATIEKFHLNNEENTNSYIKFIPINIQKAVSYGHTFANVFEEYKMCSHGIAVLNGMLLASFV
ncbi:hypothetical protein [Enterococcus rotai]|uniref:hypothetical protein n=1 Tax=Enterococcus rotai TaxID=118060 RepID=UPI0035C66D63